MSQTKTLYKLQDLEQRELQLQQQIQDINQTLANDEEIQAAQAAVTTAKDALPPLQKRSRELEAEIDDTAGKAQETEDRLYSGAVQNPKELRELQTELANLKSKQDELEESLFEIMESLEDGENALQQAEMHLESTVKTQNQKNEALVVERDRKAADAADLHEQQDAIRSEITSQNLQLYDQLKPRTRGLPVAKMHNDGTCGKCGVQQNRTVATEIRRGNAAQCGNCKRILVFL